MDPDPSVSGTGLRIRICTNMSQIPNTAIIFFWNVSPQCPRGGLCRTRSPRGRSEIELNAEKKELIKYFYQTHGNYSRPTG
jgi:hypothetical protein